MHERTKQLALVLLQLPLGIFSVIAKQLPYGHAGRQ
jgi:hypothetical protein